MKGRARQACLHCSPRFCLSKHLKIPRSQRPFQKTLHKLLPFCEYYGSPRSSNRASCLCKWFEHGWLWLSRFFTNSEALSIGMWSLEPGLAQKFIHACLWCRISVLAFFFYQYRLSSLQWCFLNSCLGKSWEIEWNVRSRPSLYNNRESGSSSFKNTLNGVAVGVWIPATCMSECIVVGGVHIGIVVKPYLSPSCIGAVLKIKLGVFRPNSFKVSGTLTIILSRWGNQVMCMLHWCLLLAIVIAV